MAKRTNTAKWMENQHRWQINVQKDGIRRSFTSSKPGRTGQREANAKADAWLDDGIENSLRVSAALNKYIASRVGIVAPETTETEKARIDLWIRPAIGSKKMDALVEGDLQKILDGAAKKGRSKKTISNIRGIIVQWLKFCRKNKITTLNPEFLEIPKSAKTKEKRILQPDAIQILFSSDTTVLRCQVTFDRYIYAYRFAVLTGIRPGELLGLRWEDISGRGSADGIPHFGNHAWPAMNHAILTFVDDSLVGGILEDIKAKSEESKDLGLRAFVWQLSDIF